MGRSRVLLSGRGLLQSGERYGRASVHDGRHAYGHEDARGHVQPHLSEGGSFQDCTQL